MTRLKILLDYLRKGDCLVLNDTKVLPARFGVKADTGAKIEVLLLKQVEGDKWETLSNRRNESKWVTVISFGDGQVESECVGMDRTRWKIAGIHL